MNNVFNNVFRINIEAKKKCSNAISYENKINSLGYDVEINFSFVYTINYSFNEKEIEKIAFSLCNPVYQNYLINDSIENLKTNKFDFVLELGFLPGVTDNVANTTTDIIKDLFKLDIGRNKVFSSKLLFIKNKSEKKFTKEDINKIAYELINILIERYHVKSYDEYIKNGMDKIIPEVKLNDETKILEINLEIDDKQLIDLGKKGIYDKNLGLYRGPLTLDYDYLIAIRDYFRKEKRNPTDIEIETIAQTWSEHCKHTIFASSLDEIKEGIFKKYIKGATAKIRQNLGKNDFCVSVFKDNSGSIIFDENFMITDKAETHNSPSALDPFGGAVTGIVGVNRDTIGFGLGALPIANKYGFCLGYPEDQDVIYRSKNKENAVLLPKRIMDGVVEGVNFGGNCSGIPTPLGFVYFDDSYKGKPLIFVGTIGLIPLKLTDGRKSYEKNALPGDNIVIIGGRVGKDGIHGATFSSEALTSGSPATAVQIGDPITQKKFSDAIIKEARDLGLYNSLTDNGAGGLSSSIGEMALQSNGFEVDLEKVPLKYPGLQPWEIWISESQERMTLSISDDKLNEFKELMERRGIEVSVIGKFTNSGRGIINFNGKKIFDMDLNFLHDGLPNKQLQTKPYNYNQREPKINSQNYKDILRKLLYSHNICSYEYISKQYDHEVQCNSVIKPLQGKGRVNGTATVIKPLFSSKKGVVISQSVLPRLSEINCYDMAANVIDTSIRNAVAVGGNINHMALMDNFCWCSSTEPERLHQLKDTAKACYDYSIIYNTPFISGKDSMFNDFKGYDVNNNEMKISALPTLMISTLSVIENVENTCTMDFKFPNDLIYVIGLTKDELGGSEYYNLFNEIGNNIPKVDANKARKLYEKMYYLINKNILSSCFSVSLGGIIVGLAKMSIAGRLGLEVDIKKIPVNENLDVETILYSETQSRFIVTIGPNKKDEFEKEMQHFIHAHIGVVKSNEEFNVFYDKDLIIKDNIDELDLVYKKKFKNY
jgi:phosphoribosylformylglycinamidine synthase subunit PurSL